MSTKKVTDEVMNNLWDDNTTKELKDGDDEVRIVYVANKHTTDTYYSVKVWFSEVDEYVTMQASALAAGTPEPLLPSEDWKDPPSGGGGGGGSPTVPTKEVVAYNSGTNFASYDGTVGMGASYGGVGMHLDNVGNPLNLQKGLSSFSLYGRKVGSPTGLARAKILDDRGAVKFESATVDVTTIGTSHQEIKFTFPAEAYSHVFDVNHYIVVYHDNGNSSNHIQVLFERNIWHHYTPVLFEKSVAEHRPLKFSNANVGYIGAKIYQKIPVCTQEQNDVLGENIDAEFQKPTSRATALDLGNIPPNSFRGLILRRIVPKGTAEKSGKRFTIFVTGKGSP